MSVKRRSSRNALLRMTQFFGIDRGVVYGAASRAWPVLAGIITVLFITAYFTQEIQGFYYTFLSLVAIQVFFELGLNQVIIQFASHEWARLRLDETGHISGDAIALARLSGLMRFTGKWFGVAAILFFLALFSAGFYSFSSARSGVHWQAPWTALCVVVALDLGLLPYWSLLEGSNQIQSIYALRFLRATATSAALWMALYLGAGLWASPISFSTGLAIATAALIWRHFRFFRSLFRIPSASGQNVVWASELWPMQWRIAISWLSGYFYFSLFTPVLFKFHGAIVAGQMGMTWNILASFSAVASVIVQTKAPSFGILIAQRKWQELDTFALRIGISAVSVAAVGASLLFAAVFFLNAVHFKLASRLLPIFPFSLLLLATVAQQVTTPMSTYLRAHKREPLMWLSLVGGGLVALTTLVFGYYWSALGIAWGYVLITCLYSVPAVTGVFLRCRRLWHTSDPIF